MIGSGILAIVLLGQTPPPDDLFMSRGFGTIYSAGFGSEHFRTNIFWGAMLNGFNLSRCEQSDGTGKWQWSEASYDNRYRVVDVASREGGLEVYVAGIDDAGNSVIEKWTYPDREGRWRHRYTGPDAPLGTPLGAYAGTTDIKGGTYTDLPRNWNPPEVEVILNSSHHGWIDCLEVDPQGRYLLFGSYGERVVNQLDLKTPGYPVTVVSTPATIPELEQLNTLLLRDHQKLGRVCVVNYTYTCVRLFDGNVATGAEKIVYLIDANNDGLFETHQTVLLTDHDASLDSDATDGGTPPVSTFYWSTPWVRS